MRSNHPPSTQRPRLERDLERAQRVAVVARNTTDDGERPALAAALAALEAAFDRAAIVNDLKIAVERHIRRGAEHPAVRARFVARAALLRTCDLDAAIVTIDRWRRDEQRAFASFTCCCAGCGSNAFMRRMRTRVRSCAATPPCWRLRSEPGDALSERTAAANRRTSRGNFRIFLARRRRARRSGTCQTRSI
jgi:hypothetical protein